MKISSSEWKKLDCKTKLEYKKKAEEAKESYFKARDALNEKQKPKEKPVKKAKDTREQSKRTVDDYKVEEVEIFINSTTITDDDQSSQYSQVESPFYYIDYNTSFSPILEEIDFSYFNLQ